MGNFVLMALGLAAGWFAGTAGAKRMVRREIGELRDLIAAQQKTAVADEPVAAPAPPPVETVAPAPAPAPVAAPAEPEEIPVDVLTLITAAVAAFLGKKARIRGVRRMPIMSASAWAQQGRVYVQASHNLQRH